MNKGFTVRVDDNIAQRFRAECARRRLKMGGTVEDLLLAWLKKHETKK